MHLSHSVNRVGSQLQPELGYMHPPFLKYALKLSTGAGLLVLVRDSTRYPLKMVMSEKRITCLNTNIGKSVTSVHRQILNSKYFAVVHDRKWNSISLLHMDDKRKVFDYCT